ncbi:glucuronate isomerase [Microbacterium sp. NEAU-LLC]|uniref:Uronate isomerase n=1 Tax=Microbacterium helvum TaxID=2773713 RepID=A0ABR8NTD6_9MICO|nr:glucuronate isomerase [Microbacterium helvum]MBD3943887.1 glucuronate isomerase [Microbacterium helvum]
MPVRLSASPDRLLPADAAVRRIAAELHAAVADAPIVSPHGHVDARLLLDDRPFADPSDLLVTPDHYVLRLLHAHGVPLDALGRGATAADPREVWRAFAAHWHMFAGTPVRVWLEDTLQNVIGLQRHPSAANADDQFDAISAWIAEPASHPRRLFERFRIDVLATTDDPADDLAAHRALAGDATWHGRVIPTFRPDRYLDPSAPGWRAALDDLTAASGTDCGTHAGLVAALEARRAFFRAAGATSTDTGVVEAWAVRADTAELERIHAAARAGDVTASDAAAYRAHMLWELARMSSEDGLVMQLHPGVLRNHHTPTLQRFGPDTGHDLPLPTSYSVPLRELLRDFGTDPGFRLVLFTVDETSFSREIAPLAGFYPSVFAGAPWWFLDSPDGIRRYREAVTDSAGFYKTSGFIDDTRAFLSIPARHDVARRMDAGWLATLVATGRLPEAEAHVIAADLVGALPRQVFRLGD